MSGAKRTSTLALSKRHETALVRLAFGPDATRDWEAAHDAFEQDFSGHWWVIEVKAWAALRIRTKGGLIAVCHDALVQAEDAAARLNSYHVTLLREAGQRGLPPCCALVHEKGRHLKNALACWRLWGGEVPVVALLSDFRRAVLGFTEPEVPVVQAEAAGSFRVKPPEAQPGP